VLALCIAGEWLLVAEVQWPDKVTFEIICAGATESGAHL
jgi:hypothetical protein